MFSLINHGLDFANMVNVIKILNAFSLSVLKLNVDYQGWNSKILVRIAKREEPDQTASKEAV